jgi:hypothetical protein
MMNNDNLANDSNHDLNKDLKLQVSKDVALAKEWFLYSGIQNFDKSDFTCGGINAWFDVSKKQYNFVYQEIVGYGISTLCYLYKIYKEPIFLERAKSASQWLLHTRKDKKGHLFRYNLEPKTFSTIMYTFDTGMILNGLTNLYELENDKKNLEECISMANWLLSVQKPNGALPALYMTDKDEYVADGNKWSLQSGAFHAKLAIGLLHLHKITGDAKFKSAAIKLCDFALTFQQPDGRFITDTTDNSTFVHPHCYTMEGLITAGIYLQEQKYINAVKKGINWILNNQSPNGSMPFKYVSDFMQYDSPDFSAQVLRMYLILRKQHISVDAKFNMDKLVRNILLYQSADEDKRCKGGFYSGNGWFVEDPVQTNKKHVNSWVSMFVLETLEILDDKTKEFDVFNIV